MPATNRAGEPRPAATVVVLRDSDDGLQVLLTQRPEHLPFMGGAVVFPGGAVARADLDPRWDDCSALTGRDAAALLGIEHEREALSYFVCALREAFEEVGLLLAAGPSEALSAGDARDPDAFLQRCLEVGVTLATDRLVPAGRWVTPLGAPVRFDTRFFMAAALDAWVPRADPAEVARCYWSTPSAALAELGSGRTIMAPPTVETLQHLAVFQRVDGALRSTRDRPTEPTVLRTRLSPVVSVVLAPNPGPMTGPGTNTYIVGRERVVVIDPAVPDEAFTDALLQGGPELAAILVTHRHPDHIGGVARLQRLTGAEVRAFGQQPVGVDVRPLADGEVIDVPGVRLLALHTPGHAADHLCFYLEGAASLFSGDNVLGEGTAVIAPPDGDMQAYLSSLRRLQRMDIDRIYPGHWRPLDGGKQVIEWYLQHRAEREAMIVGAIERGAGTAEQIVELVYTDTPSSLHPVAVYQVRAHLELLKQRGVVAHSGGRWTISRDDQMPR